MTAIGSAQQVARVFAFQRMATTNGVRDWTYMDAMLSTFRTFGQRAIMVLTDGWGGQPCTDYVGGHERTIGWYQTGYRKTVEGATTYREWVKEIVTRYRNDATVAYWELINEPRAANADLTCTRLDARAALRTFADDVGGLVKSIDPNHLVMLGLGPGACGSGDVDYSYIMASSAIDLLAYHDYGYPTSPMGDPSATNGLAATLARARALGKPLVVGEVGIQFKSLTIPTMAYRATLLDAKLAAQFKAGSVGEMVWCWSNTYSAKPPRDYEVAPGDPALTMLTRY